MATAGSGSGEAQGYAAGEGFALTRQQRSIGGDHDNDRAGSGCAGTPSVALVPVGGFDGIVGGQLTSQRNAGNAQFGARSEVGLHQGADCEVGAAVRHDAR